MAQENNVAIWIYLLRLTRPEATVRSFMAEDPAVCAGVMTAELHPFHISLEHPPCR